MPGSGRFLHGRCVTRGKAMNEESDIRERSPSSEESQERVPVMQRMLDNPFLLLFLGVTIPAVSYIIWGVMEIVTIPVGR